MQSLIEILQRLKAMLFFNASSSIDNGSALVGAAKLEELKALSCHYDGFKREKAVIKLEKFNDPKLIPLLLERANDWVPQVRNAALKALNSIINTENIDYVITFLPEIYHLERCSRSDHSSLITATENLFIQSHNSEKLINGIGSDNRFIARLCLDLSIRKEIVAAPALLRLALRHHDVLVRMKALNWIDANAPKDLKANYQLLLKDPFMPIRKHVVKMMLKTNKAKAIAQQALLDRHSSIRELAIGFCNNNKIDALSFYRKNISVETDIKVSIWGLGFYKNQDELAIVKQYFESKSPSLRKQALNAALKIKPEMARCYTDLALVDTSPSVCKEAVKLSIKHSIVRTAGELLQLLKSASFDNSARCFMTLAHNSNKWEHISFLLPLFDLQKQGYIIDQDHIATEIQQWNANYNRSFVQPTKQQVDTIHKLVASPAVLQNFKGANHLMRLLQSFTD